MSDMPTPSLIEKITPLWQMGVLYGPLSIMGGVTRVLVLGLEPNETMRGEIARHAFVALPIGILAGWIASTHNLSHDWPWLPYAAAYAFGTVAHNVARKLATGGWEAVFLNVLSEAIKKVKK